MLEMMAGRVDETKEGHFVGTVFIAFIGPLIPLRSMYVVRETISRHGNATTMRWEGVDLPLNARSVLLGYVRVWLPIFAFAAPFALMWGQAVEFDRPEYLVSLALLLVWLVALAGLGKLRGERKRQLAVLGDVTGLALDPAAFEVVSRVGRADAIGYELSQRGIPTDDPRALADALGRDAEALLPTAYAYARYRAVGDRAWADAAAQLWARIAPRPA